MFKNKVEVRNGLIVVYASNTGTGFVFDYSDQLLENLKEHTWSEDATGYLRCISSGRLTFAHHLVLPKVVGMDVDHINRCKWDNRASNLRYLTRSGTGINRDIFRNNTSGRVGVTWHKRIGKWQSRIYVSGRSVHLGYYETFEDAVESRKSAEELYYPRVLLFDNSIATSKDSPYSDLSAKRVKSSRYVGVSRRSRRSNRWRAYVNIGGRRVNLGTFPDEKSAWQARRCALKDIIQIDEDGNFVDSTKGG